MLTENITDLSLASSCMAILTFKRIVEPFHLRLLFYITRLNHPGWYCHFSLYNLLF